MLRPALNHKAQITEEFLKMSVDPKYDYNFAQSYHDLEFKPVEDTWNGIQFVSTAKINSELLGLFSAKIDRAAYHVSALIVTSFKNELHIEFLTDLNEFFNMMFTRYNFNKVCWATVVGNPIEQTWDKFCERSGGRVVGTYYEDVRIPDGRLCDRKLYEVQRKNWLVSRS